jgi:hypothetical protein
VQDVKMVGIVIRLAPELVQVMEELKHGNTNIGLIKIQSMKRNILLNFCLILSLGIFQISCSGENSNSESDQELPNPLTIKGMKLGLDFKSQIKVGEQNGLCKSEFENGRCHYELSETIMAEPKLTYSLFNENKVLDFVEITLFSPFNFPTVSDENGNVVAEYPSLTKAEIQEVIDMYNKKYGKPNEETWEYGGSEEWIVNDEMQITLTYTTTEYAFGFQIHPQIKEAFITDAFSTKVVYEYTEKYKELLKEDPNINGEPIGDNI